MTGISDGGIEVKAMGHAVIDGVRVRVDVVGPLLDVMVVRGPGLKRVCKREVETTASGVELIVEIALS